MVTFTYLFTAQAVCECKMVVITVKLHGDLSKGSWITFWLYLYPKTKKNTSLLRWFFWDLRPVTNCNTGIPTVMK